MPMCPTPLELERMVRGELADDESRELREHTETCAACSGQLSFLVADTQFSGGLRRALAVQDAPAQIGGCRLLREIGRGGMGIVYLAEQASPLRQVAIKLLPPWFDSERWRRRFELEVRALGQLDHPNLAHIFGAGVVDGRPYFIMEYIDGVPLDRDCVRRGIGDALIVHRMAEIADAVHGAHQRGVLHGDLKPGNILVDRDGRPRVIDFGLARVLEGDGRSLSLEGQAGPAGTLAYMAPEQLDASATADVRSDVYSLGVILYQLLCRRLPLDVSGLALPAALERVKRQELTPPLAARADLPRDLDHILRTALASDPPLRYASAHALADDLRRYLASRPILARPPSTWYHLTRFAQRNRVAMGLAGLLLLSLAAFALVHQSSRRALAQERAGRELLRDRAVAEALRVEGRALGPAEPQNLARYQFWLERFQELTSQRSRYDQGMLALLDQMDEPSFGVSPFVLSQLDYGQAVEERTIRGVEAQRRWREAIASIADPAQCPAYAGLKICPQLGLLPLRQDPVSHLWEFAHIQSGAEPEIGADGKYSIETETCLVLILVPGGGVSKVVGPRKKIERLVLLDPYFLAKYEMTQAQWTRADRCLNPSKWRPGSYFATGEGPIGLTETQPVESVHWHSADRVCRNLGLTLPTLAQWEFAARCEGRASYGIVNCQDQAFHRKEKGKNPVPPIDDGHARPGLRDALSATQWGFWIVNCWDLAFHFQRLNKDEIPSLEIDDGHACPGAVDTLSANPWGFYHMIGNVGEWCLDSPLATDSVVEPAAGTGLLMAPGDGMLPELRLGVGGAFNKKMTFNRETRCVVDWTTLTNADLADSRHEGLGLRPARALVLTPELTPQLERYRVR